MTRTLTRKGPWLILLIALNACTTVPPKDAPVAAGSIFQGDRTELLGDIGAWGLQGKISLDDGDEGGSGRLQWDVTPGFSELDFHGALGRGAWRLQVGEEGALLQLADGTEQTAPRVGQLIQDHIGWSIPLEALQWWVRGLAAPGVIENQALGPEGLLLSLRQFGWNVRFNRYDSFDGVAMPVRLDANRENYRVKLAISHWRLGVDGETTD